MRIVFGALAAATLCSVWAIPAVSEESDNRPAKGIQDNSFLIEEAYNQEAGVVQHISGLRRQDRDWFFNFTQEWPVVSQIHQFSYSVPYAWIGPDGATEQGFGDIMLNYRWQALFENAAQPAFAPRISLILPTGDRDKDLGNESLGYQVNLPVSKIVSDRTTLHANAGVTTYVDVDDLQPTSFNAGGSVIYAVNRDFNLMLETLGEWEESVGETSEIERAFTFTVSPGVRYAFNLPDGQFVLGVAAPVSFSKGERDYGAFVYLSFEHEFLH